MKKAVNIIFCVMFFCLLALPLVFTDFRKDQRSEIDNNYLPELDTSDVLALQKSAEPYINARIGFRAESLDLYQQINDKVFGLMEHPSFMYGKEGHVFYKAPRYIKDYQHLNLSKKKAAAFADGIKGFQEYCGKNDKMFLYFLIPDKKTVYAEYFPDEIHVKGTTSRTDQMLKALKERQVDLFWAKDVMLAGKERMEVCNKKYDATHWNENGAFLVIQKLYEILGERYPEIGPLSAEDYNVTTSVMTSLPTSHFTINEETPLYELKNKSAAKGDKEKLDSLIYPSEKDNYATRAVNPAQSDKPKLLLIHDSYMMRKEKFFTENFSEVTFIHRYNIYNQDVFEYYVRELDPDIVIYENPERSWPIDLFKEYTLPAEAGESGK